MNATPLFFTEFYKILLKYVSYKKLEISAFRGLSYFIHFNKICTDKPGAPSIKSHKALIFSILYGFFILTESQFLYFIIQSPC